MRNRPWWKDSVIYHIYPRSFYDTNADGIGDLRGITERLGHIRDLGADAIWMGPVFRSPQIDNGYDISDYRDIDPLFGTLDDMDELIEAAHRNGIRVLLDLVFNHTSDQHPWFQKSLHNPESKEADFYIWRDPAPDGGPPNNWRAFFSVPAWTYASERGQYYLHLFAPEQPDLNWENPRVREELADIANFWLAREVDGFRLDVINVISKRPGLPSSPRGDRSGFFIDGPRVLPYLQEFRSRLSAGRDVLLVGETPGVSPEAARAYTLPENGALDMVLVFDHVTLDHGPGGRWDPRPLSVPHMRSVIDEWQDTLGEPCWPSIYLSNHDQPRVVSRYGNDAEYRFESATALATVFYLQRGTPIVYQGDEIAMANYPIERAEDIVDVETRNAYTHLVRERGVSTEEALERVRNNARDHGRTPMQWSADPNAGFIAGGAAAPWYPVNPDYPKHNVADQNRCAPAPAAGEPAVHLRRAPGTADRSVLCYFRSLFELRRARAPLRRGAFELLPVVEGSSVVAFHRTLEGESVAVVANLSDSRTRLRTDALGRRLSGRGPSEPGAAPTLLLTNYADRIGLGAGPEEPAPEEKVEEVLLRPWECMVTALAR